jgi:xanthine dehydrogenase YagR molybdenum-binding subunit
MSVALGDNVERADGHHKVMGHPIYGADRAPKGVVHAVPLTASIGKGRIVSIDTTAAEQLPGILLVLTYTNMDRLKPIMFSFAGGQAIQSLQPMQSAEIAYWGQAVALVVGETLEAATEGASLVKISYEAIPIAVRLNEEGREDVRQAETAPYFQDFIRGNADGLLQAGDTLLDQTYTTPAQHQNPMELLSTVAVWSGEKLTVYEGTQAAQAMQQGLALQLDILPGNVRVISPYTGGGFGQRGSISPHTVFAAVAARRTRRPVKLTVPRSQIFHATSFRPATEHRFRIAAKNNGEVVAAIHEVRAQTSRFDLMPFTGEETTSRMYAWPAFKGTTTLVKLDTQTPGFMRAPMEMSSMFALESAMDELAERLELDPVAFRLMNDASKDPITGKPFSSRRLKECLQRGAERFGWSRRTSAPRSMRAEDGSLLGWGVGAGAYPGYISPALANVRIHANGSAAVSVGGHEMGQGIRTAVAIVVAEQLGIDLLKVDVTIGDTAFPPQHTTAGSWGAATATVPARLAAISAKRQLINLAVGREGGTFSGAEISEFTLRDGYVVHRDGREEKISDILKLAGKNHIDGIAEGTRPGMKPDALQTAALGKIAITGPEFPHHVTFSFIAHFVEVRVDPLTPRPRVTRMVSVVDCGRVISRRTALSQVHGGLVWGIGAALSEASEVDSRFGGFVNNNIAEYQVAVNADVRQCEVEFIDEQDGSFNDIGAKGLGEVACVGAAGAIANAVYHATGIRVRRLPIRVEDLLPVL